MHSGEARTSYARDYDRLFELLNYEREHGNIVWVMGPAFAFDHDARACMQALVENGYVDALLAGNALATHDLEGALLNTALGQDIYTQKSHPNGHYICTLEAISCLLMTAHQFLPGTSQKASSVLGCSHTSPVRSESQLWNWDSTPSLFHF